MSRPDTIKLYFGEFAAFGPDARFFEEVQRRQKIMKELTDTSIGAAFAESEQTNGDEHQVERGEI